MLEGSRHWEDFAKGSCLLLSLSRGVETCGDTSLVFFLQKVVLRGAPVSVTFTLDLVSGYGWQHTCPEGLMRVRSPAAVGR